MEPATLAGWIAAATPIVLAARWVVMQMMRNTRDNAELKALLHQVLAKQDAQAEWQGRTVYRPKSATAPAPQPPDGDS